MRTVKLVIGILSCVLVLVVMLQSCGASFVTAVEQSDDLSGGVGVIFGIVLLAAGITAIAGRNSKGGTIGAGILYVIGAALGLTSNGVYGDLQVWGGVSGVFGIVFLLSLISMREVAQTTPAVEYAPRQPEYRPEYKPVETKPVSTEAAPAEPAEAPRVAPVQLSDIALNAFPVYRLSEKSHWVVQWLRIVAKTLIVLVEVGGICCSYFFLTPVLMKYVAMDSTYCAILSIVIGALGASLVGVAFCLPLLGMALMLDDLHALRLYASGYTISNKR